MALSRAPQLTDVLWRQLGVMDPTSIAVRRDNGLEWCILLVATGERVGRCLDAAPLPAHPQIAL